jgi:nitrile hydratase
MLAVPTLAVPERRAGAALPRDAAEPVFPEPWQAHAFAVVISLYQDGHYTWAEWDDYLGYHIQAPGHFGGATAEDADAAETGEAEPDASKTNYSPFLAACERDGSRFYHLWLAAAEHLLDARGLVTEAELAERIAVFEKAERDGPRFAGGQRVMVRDIKREGHTHLPLYLRGKTGVVESDRGLFVFPDGVGHDHDIDGIDTLQHVYCVRFSAAEIRGEVVGTGHSLNFNLWDYQLEAA